MNRYTVNVLNSKLGGDISKAFASLSGGGDGPLPARYSALKHTIVPEANEVSLVAVWGSVLSQLSELVAYIKAKGPQVNCTRMAVNRRD